MGSFFKFSQERKNTFVAGLSMGGFGALKLALNCPEKFAAAGCFSSAIRPAHLLSVIPDRKAEFNSIFGDMSLVDKSCNDMYYMAEKQQKDKTDLPFLYLACGTEDFLYQENQMFKKHLEKLNVPFTYYEEPGTHEWGFWDRRIQDFLKLIHEKNLL